MKSLLSEKIFNFQGVLKKGPNMIANMSNYPKNVESAKYEAYRLHVLLGRF